MSTITQSKRAVALFLLLCISCLAACSPKYNWREVRGKDAPFEVLFPDKPVTVTRGINLGGEPVTMTMTAAEVDGVNFAVGYAVLANAGKTPAALNAMRETLVNNINGTIKGAQPVQTPGMSGNASDIEALGRRGGAPLLLLGHFEAKGNRVYQVIVLGNESAVSREESKTFLASFKAH